MKESAKYIRLFEKIQSEIALGVYKNGERIPGENELAQKYQMSRQTVRQSLSLLEQKGLIARRQGSGTYVTQKLQRKKKTWNVGVIATYISEYIFPSILRGMENELSRSGFSPVLNATKNRVDSERGILEEFLRKNVDGLIVEGTKSALPNPNVGLYEAFNKAGIPVVFFNSHYPVMKDSVYVRMDDKSGGYDTVAYLAEKGHRKIGGIFKSDDLQGVDRYAGYLQAIIDRELPMQDEWIHWFNSENRSYLLEEEADRMVKSWKDCIAVVCYNDEIAVKLINALVAKGIRVPQDMAVIGFDNSLFSEVSQVRITSLDHPKELLGAAAARKLLSMIGGKQEKSLVMDWQISEKDSV